MNTIGCEEQDGEPEGLQGRSDNALIPLNIFLQQLASNNAAESDDEKFGEKARPPSGWSGKKPKSPKRPKSPKTPSSQGLQNTPSLNLLAGRHLARL